MRIHLVVNRDKTVRGNGKQSLYDEVPGLLKV